MSDKFMTSCQWCDVAVCPLCHYPHIDKENYKDSILCLKHDPETGYDGFLGHASHDRHCCCKQDA